jgi:hypothetical protein
MYAIDFETCTPADLIKRSIVCHPSLFADRMDAIALVHTQASASLSYHRDRATAQRLSAACAYVAHMLRTDDENADELTAKIMLLGMDYWISSLNVAAKLQCVPFHIVSGAVERFEAKRNAEA